MSILDKNIFKKREFIVLCIILAIGVVMSFAAADTFPTSGNMMTIALGLCADGFVVIGCTLILIAGEIDLSVGSIQCLASVLVGAFFSRGTNIWVAAILAILICSCIGCITGGIISKLGGASSFIITLGMQGAIRGLCYIITKGTSITITGEGLDTFKFLGGGYVASLLPTFFVLLLIAIAISHFLLRNTKFCAKTYFIGSNINAADLAGIKVKRMRVFLYMISALTAAIAGVLCSARFGVASPILGQGADGRAITASVIGGTSMSGGEGGIFGSFLGLVLVQLISNSLIQLNVSVYWQDFISNMLMITVIVIDALSRISRNKSLPGYASGVKTLLPKNSNKESNKAN